MIRMDSTVHRFKNARIAMYLGDHPPPHVHLTGPGFKALIEIDGLKVLGSADAKTLAEAKAWINDHRATLMEIWKLRGTKR